MRGLRPGWRACGPKKITWSPKFQTVALGKMRTLVSDDVTVAGMPPAPVRDMGARKKETTGDRQRTLP